MLMQLPFIVIGIPFFTAFVVFLCSYFFKKSVYPLTVISLFLTFVCSLKLTSLVKTNGSIRYIMGGWSDSIGQIGITFNVDSLNTLVVVIVSLVTFLVAWFSKEPVKDEIAHKIGGYYTLFLLFVSGLLGITMTEDAFNLYVLIEVAALTSYALLAMGGKRSQVSTFNYLIMATIGACFYLLGVGYLLLKTGTLNMSDLHPILTGLVGSQAVLIAFLLITLGLWAKMAFFPFHGWVSNVYTYSPISSAALIAPLMTKVSVYVLIRMMYSVFGSDYVYNLPYQSIVMWMAVIAILLGSFYALMQTNVRKMLTFLIVAEIGYMVGGMWLGSQTGLTGSIYHILADALMTVSLFLSIGSVAWVVKSTELAAFKGIFKRMPLTMIGFLIGAFSMIGVPPTCGFFSKWYLLSGAFEVGAWHYFIALIVSSLINVVLFFRIIEVGFFNALPDEEPDHHAKIKLKEPPVSMMLPTLISSVLLVVLGLNTSTIVTLYIEPFVQSVLKVL